MPLSGIAVAEVGVGGLILYSGIKGSSIADTFTSLVKAKTPAQTEAIAQADYPSGSAAPGDTGAANNTAADNQALAKQILTEMGLSSWTTGQEWQDLVSLWNKESGWSVTADNPSSGAYGIPQALPASKMASAGADWKTNPATQIRWGIGYIEGRYGSPSMAWAHEVANDWY